VTLFVTVLACTLIGDALRDAFDPRARERREEGVLK
jgi:ABC-type dipeptide/oligopeptide/nickel transport system permease subunit